MGKEKPLDQEKTVEMNGCKKNTWMYNERDFDVPPAAAVHLKKNELFSSHDVNNCFIYLFVLVLQM